MASLSRGQRRVQRALEVAPGALTWTILIAPLVAAYPAENKVVAIVTRESDRLGWENVHRLQQEFGHRLRAFVHIKDPLLPGIVVGKSAAMAYGGPVLRHELEAMGLDQKDVIVTD